TEAELKAKDPIAYHEVMAKKDSGWKMELELLSKWEELKAGGSTLSVERSNVYS
ncbi:hypothetical protein H0H87_004717, partial [Tephrocybe sp. NHM501043]